MKTRSFLATLGLCSIPVLAGAVGLSLRLADPPPPPKHAQSRADASSVERCTDDCRAAACERWDSCDQGADPLDCKTAVLRLERLCVRRCSPAAIQPMPFLHFPDRWRGWPI